MKKGPGRPKKSEAIIKDVKRRTKRLFNPEEKIAIVLEVYSPRKRATMKSRIIRFRDYEDQQIYRKPDCQVIT